MDKSVALSNIIMELHVPSFDVVREFYGKLGFVEVWSYPPKDQSGYMVMQRVDSVLAFFCGNEEVYNHSYFNQFDKSTPRGYGTELAIYITDVDIEKYYSDVVSKIDQKYVVQELMVKPWGSKDFRLIDPFGFYLCFREPTNILHK